jgi:hypothetical protein
MPTAPSRPSSAVTDVLATRKLADALLHVGPTTSWSFRSDEGPFAGSASTARGRAPSSLGDFSLQDPASLIYSAGQLFKTLRAKSSLASDAVGAIVEELVSSAFYPPHALADIVASRDLHPVPFKTLLVDVERTRDASLARRDAIGVEHANAEEALRLAVDAHFDVNADMEAMEQRMREFEIGLRTWGERRKFVRGEVEVMAATHAKALEVVTAKTKDTLKEAEALTALLREMIPSPVVQALQIAVAAVQRLVSLDFRGVLNGLRVKQMVASGKGLHIKDVDFALVLRPDETIDDFEALPAPLILLRWANHHLGAVPSPNIADFATVRPYERLLGALTRAAFHAATPAQRAGDVAKVINGVIRRNLVDAKEVMGEGGVDAHELHLAALLYARPQLIGADKEKDKRHELFRVVEEFSAILTELSSARLLPEELPPKIRASAAKMQRANVLTAELSVAGLSTQQHWGRVNEILQVAPPPPPVRCDPAPPSLMM